MQSSRHDERHFFEAALDFFVKAGHSLFVAVRKLDEVICLLARLIRQSTPERLASVV
jgi:hypothetical protein